MRIEGSKKACNLRELNPGHLACASSTLPLSYGNRTTTSPHNPLYVPHKQYWMPRLHTWQPLGMCNQNSIRDRLEILSMRTELMLSIQMYMYMYMYRSSQLQEELKISFHWLLQLRGRTPADKPRGCPFHFPLFSPQNISGVRQSIQKKLSLTCMVQFTKHFARWDR